MDGSALKGVITPLITPFRGSGIEPAVDYDSLDRLIEWQLASGVHGFCPCGTTGESATLSHEEKLEVIRFTVERVRGRVPVIAGTGSNCTKTTVEFSKEAARLGVDAALVVSPYYNKPTQEGLYRHYRAVAESVDIPQILYNVPGRTACDLLPATAARLSTVPNIIGLKEATGQLGRVRELIDGCGEGFALYSGDDASACEFCLLGGHGVISVTANVAPKAMHDMCAAAIAGLRTDAKALDERLSALHRDLFIESNPIPVKWALEQMGLIPGGIRLPLTRLSDECHEAVRHAMRHAGAL